MTTTQHQDLQDMTFQMAVAFSDIRAVERVFLLIDHKTGTITKTKELSDKHFINALSNKNLIVDLKSQQVFDHGKRDWKDISEERKADSINSKKGRRAGKRSGKTKEAKGPSSTNRKTGRGTRRKHNDSDET